ncbi:MAG TPA: amidohydrolase family protein [Gemmatimonadaceae bacterium]|nr:amidohydrolase family protein [Gemmatimonadaceae bacterium]
MKRYHARWVVPVTQRPIQNGCVVEHNGIIEYVGESDKAPAGEDHDLGESVLLPGIINTHTHLELTAMRGFLEDLCFNDWIDKLRSSRKEALTDEMLLDSARYGIVEGLHAGITTYADTCAAGLVFDAMLELGVRGIMFQETFGSAPEQSESAMEVLKERVAELKKKETDLVRVGISPHAPYTISDDLYAATARYARESGLRMGLHIAESESETRIVCSADGPFAIEWNVRGLPLAPRARTPVELLEKTGCLATSPLLIHCVNLDAEDIETIARHKCSVAHCPASNAKFGHGISPVADLIAAGVTVGLGSDSVASNNRMDILEEARLAILFQRAIKKTERAFTAQQALEMATIGGARALRIDDKVGSLEVGKEADLAAFSLEAARVTPIGDIVAAILFAVAGTPAHFVAVKGRPLLAEREPLAVDPELRRRVAAAGESLAAWDRAGTWVPATVGSGS